MKKLLVKLLGLETLFNQVELLRKENNELKKSLVDLKEQFDEIELPDEDDFVKEDDINDRIESYCCDNDIVSSSYVDDEIESKVSDKVEEAIDDLDLTEKVKEVVSDMDKASFGDTEELKTLIREVLKTIKFKVE